MHTDRPDCHRSNELCTSDTINDPRPINGFGTGRRDNDSCHCRIRWLGIDAAWILVCSSSGIFIIIADLSVDSHAINIRFRLLQLAVVLG